MERFAILGIGNTYVTDDGVGVYIVRDLKERVRDPRVVCTELSVSGLDTLEHLSGFDEALIVDAAKTGSAPVGEMWTISPSQFACVSPALSLHTIGVQAALRLGSIMGLKVPCEVTLFAVEVKDTETFHEGCTSEVESAIACLTRKIVGFLKSRFPDHECRPETKEAINLRYQRA